MARQSLLAPAWPDRSCLRLHGQDLLAAGGGTRGPRAELEASRKEVDSLRKEVSILQVGVRARARVCVCVCARVCLSARDAGRSCTQATRLRAQSPGCLPSPPVLRPMAQRCAASVTSACARSGLAPLHPRWR